MPIQAVPTVPVTPAPQQDPLQFREQGPTDRDRLNDALERIRQLEELNAKAKLDERFAGILDQIKKGDAANTAESMAIKNDLAGVVTRQQGMLELLNNQTNMLKQMQSQLDRGVSMRTEIDGRLGPVVTRPLGGDPFILRRSLLEP